MKRSHHLLLLIIHLLFISSLAFPSSFLRNITQNFQNMSSNPWDYFNNFTGCHIGDNRDGLSKLKQYFQRFGYLTDSTNFTDDFDDSLESALKTYQLNFNLNSTGFLDESTLQQMVKPRCGVADIINGSTTMNSGKPTSPKNLNSVAHFTFFPGQPRWPSSNQDLTYAFFPGNQLTPSVKAVFKRAFAKWSAVTPLKFTETQLFRSADITVGFFSGDHGDGEPFDGLLGTLAHAFSPRNGRFHLDDDENWIVEGDVSTSSLRGAIDLESVAVHEIGHLLGLGHSSDENAIMFPTISSGTKKVELARDDVEGVQTLYGGNPNFNGSESVNTPSRQERDTSGATRTHHGSSRIALMLVAVLLSLLFVCGV